MAGLLVDADRKVLCGILDGVGDKPVLRLVRVDSLNLRVMMVEMREG